MTTDHPWPAVDHETLPWAATSPYLDAFQRRRVARPYEAAVPPSIAAAHPRVSARVAALTEEATLDVARFDSAMASLPVPMPTVLLRTESASSSQIEHLTTNARNLALASLGVPSRQNADLVAANVRAMTGALAAGDDVTAAGILAVHRALLAESEPETAGRWRSEQVWVGASPISPHGADFVPPHHDRVPLLVDDLVAFAARDDVPALVLAAVVHAQFETIHPFTDGNGRTGRVLVHTVLRRRGLALHTTVPVSAGLLRDPESYFRALGAYRDGDLDPIVEQIASAAVAATANGRQLAAEVVAARARWRDAITARSDSAAWPLSDLLFSQPVVTAEYAARALGVSDRAARNAIEVLQEAGVLHSPSTGHRARVWQAAEVLAAMDAFSARAGRRRAGR
jgi:Fic family protein